MGISRRPTRPKHLKIQARGRRPRFGNFWGPDRKADCHRLLGILTQRHRRAILRCGNVGAPCPIIFRTSELPCAHQNKQQQRGPCMAQVGRGVCFESATGVLRVPTIRCLRARRRSLPTQRASRVSLSLSRTPCTTVPSEPKKFGPTRSLSFAPGRRNTGTPPGASTATTSPPIDRSSPHSRGTPEPALAPVRRHCRKPPPPPPPPTPCELRAGQRPCPPE